MAATTVTTNASSTLQVTTSRSAANTWPAIPSASSVGDSSRNHDWIQDRKLGSGGDFWGMSPGSSLTEDEKKAPRMSDPWESDWPRLRGGLLRVRHAVDVRRARDLDRETSALRAVAAESVFSTLHTQVDGEERGRVIATYVTGLVQRTLHDYPDEDRRGTAVLRDWSRIVTEGVTSGQLAAEGTPPGAPSEEAKKAEQRIEYRLWLGGSRRSTASRAAIHALYTSVTGGLDAHLDIGGHAALVGSSVAWEWDGLRQRGDTGASALLGILAFVAPDVPVRIRTLSDGRGPLPGPLRQLLRYPPEARPVLADLAHRGLLTHHRAPVETVQVAAPVQQVIRSRLTAAEQKELASALLRSLKVGLPSASHDHATWDEWSAGSPHVLAVIDACQTLGIRAGDCAYLLDRTAVYIRDARDDPTGAISLGERARALADLAGRPNQVDYANILGNIAIALRHLGRHTDAIPLMQECARITAAAVGDLHHEHIESLLGLANALAGAGRGTEARTQYEQALDQARRAFAETSGQAQRSMLTEVLNDYASRLLDTEPPQPGWRDDALQAGTLLDDARRLIRPGDHGWHQVAINRAIAHHRLGETPDADALLRETIDYCENTFGHYTYPTFGAVTALLDVYEDTDDPRYEDLLIEAHDIDDHLAAPAQDRPSAAEPNPAAAP